MGWRDVDGRGRGDRGGVEQGVEKGHIPWTTYTYAFTHIVDLSVCFSDSNRILFSRGYGVIYSAK